jgi:excisionase family DNA binding protein
MATSAIETELLTVTEAAAILRVSKATCYRLIQGGHIPAHRLGDSTIRIDRAEMLDALARHPVRVEEDPE